MWKEKKDAIRKRTKDNLKESATRYADHVENTISKLQEAYLKKYHPLEYSRSTKASQPPGDVQNKRFGGKVSALFRGPREPELVKPAKSEEGIPILPMGSNLVYKKVRSGLETDYACRVAVRRLNVFRSKRAEYLGDGYDVSDILCYDIDLCLHQTLKTQSLEELIFTPTVKDILVKYMDGMMSVFIRLRNLSWFNLTWNVAQHTLSMTTFQRVLRQKSRKPWPEQIRLI
jgi:hypothetical protein